MNSAIYVGVDHSWRDTGAFEWALQESNLRREPLRAIHVFDERLRPTSYWEPAVVDAQTTELIEDVRRELKSRGGDLDVDADLTAGSPAKRLAEAGADGSMIVVGRRGMGTFQRLLVGSTSEALVHAATVPVVVVPADWKTQERTGPVVVAIGKADEQHAAIEFAATAAVERHIPLRMVHAWDLPNIYSSDAAVVARIEDEWADGARRVVNAAADHWRRLYPDLAIETVAVRGHPVGRVVAAAEQSHAPLLVVGGHRRHRMSPMLLGSVARGVLHHASCPVAVVHDS
ncbi:universal stress protein [Kribbella sp. NPDC050820]|uniref:universal stress protein n=1 Tax=Kribbella sp. NPDC050820 TaxID=3155408 RepID=UPI0033CBEBB2